ncbi:MAG: glycosyltransferase family 4 protein [Candidatus Binataceae bacterium]
MTRAYKLACLTTHPIQYQAPLFRYLSADPAIDLTVLFLSDISIREYHDRGFGVRLGWDVPLLEGYRHAFLPCLGRSDRLSMWRPLVYGLRGRLAAGGFDAIWLHGYAHQGMLRAIAVAKALGIKVLLRGESHLRCESRSLPALCAKHGLLPGLLRMMDGFLAIGTLNREYYLRYGIDPGRIFMTPYAVDNEFFRIEAQRARQTRERLRAQLGLAPNRPVILYASKFLRRKRAGDLLEAYIRLSPHGRREPNPYLLFVGDGAERPKLEARVSALGWSSVKFVGFKNQTELPGYYDLCDVFVMPSEREPWGLVINEVMNAGKPVVATDEVGAAADLVIDGENGFVVPVGDLVALAERLRRLTTEPRLAAAMGDKSLKRIAGWNFEADRQGLLAALGAVTGRPEKAAA